MLSNKRGFLTGLIISPVLCLSFLGGLSAAQAQNSSQQINTEIDSLTGYIQSDAPTIFTETVPAVAPICQNRAMDVVAHEDDDILFMNPNLQHSLSHGDCVQTVYMTAGDDGMGPDYWMQREHGAEAAYSTMLNQPDDWQEKQIRLDNRWSVSTASLEQAPNVTLTFIRLPDGNLAGEGFASTSFESLQKLEAGQIDKIHTVDGQATYGLSDLTALLAYLINQYRPDQIRTQANDYPDHSDHIATGQLTVRAFELYGTQTIPIKSTDLNFYQGYPIDGQPPNLSGDDFTHKKAAFLEYAKYDSPICGNPDQCNDVPTYESYFTRQYQSQN